MGRRPTEKVVVHDKLRQSQVGHCTVRCQGAHLRLDSVADATAHVAAVAIIDILNGAARASVRRLLTATLLKANTPPPACGCCPYPARSHT
jgi:hypothetical protein